LFERCNAEQILASAHVGGVTNYGQLAAALAERYLAFGDVPRAAKLLNQVLDLIPSVWHDCMRLVPIAVCCPKPDVERAARFLERKPTDVDSTFWGAFRSLFWGYASARFGTRDDKVRYAQTAARLFERLGMKLFEAESRELAEESGRALAMCQATGAIRVPRRLQKAGTLPKAEALTPREREIFDLVCRRLSTRAIASDLSLSERTVESHIAAVFRKFNIRSRGELYLLFPSDRGSDAKRAGFTREDGAAMHHDSR
jgi:DNA-binding CsgD family transcriptional regulator